MQPQVAADAGTYEEPVLRNPRPSFGALNFDAQRALPVERLVRIERIAGQVHGPIRIPRAPRFIRFGPKRDFPWWLLFKASVGNLLREHAWNEAAEQFDELTTLLEVNWLAAQSLGRNPYLIGYWRASQLIGLGTYPHRKQAQAKASAE
jgi:hypothetical protein